MKILLFIKILNFPALSIKKSKNAIYFTIFSVHNYITGLLSYAFLRKCGLQFKIYIFPSFKKKMKILHFLQWMLSTEETNIYLKYFNSWKRAERGIKCLNN